MKLEPMPSTVGMPDFSKLEDKEQISVIMGQWQQEVQLNLMRYTKEHAEWTAAGNLTETDSDSDVEVIIPGDSHRKSSKARALALDDCIAKRRQT